jgi:hypothetical protein
VLVGTALVAVVWVGRGIGGRFGRRRRPDGRRR